MSQEGHAALPPSPPAREPRYRVDRPGFRVKVITPATTLPDAEAFPARKLVDRYPSRWQVEVDLRHPKTTLGMEILRCKTPEGVLKELTLYAVAYDLVRLVMLEAGRRQGVAARRVSFVDALRWPASSPPGTPPFRPIVNPVRPERVEPRCQKRRGKIHPFLILPGSELRERLLGKADAA
jgi:hypothetical protein